MTVKILPLALIALLLAGCTVNPKDSIATVTTSNAVRNSSPPADAVPSSNGTRTFTLTEIARHSTKKDCWMAIGGNVYDFSTYSGHPGGDTYVPYCGTDATAAFSTKGGMGIDHSQNAYTMLANYLIGELGNATNPAK
jgi:cytochrome b involved in lipid metabolism